jgi:PrcB C-terminal
MNNRAQLVALLVGGAALAVPSAQVAFTTVSQGQQSGIEERREVVVRDAKALAALWTDHAPGEPPPPVDFGTAIVVGVFAGLRNTGGHEVEVTGVARDGDTLVVTHRERAPAGGDMTAQVLTFPYHLVRVPRHEGPVRFRRAS